MRKRICVGMLLLFLCGCIKTKDELTINADGSGKVRIETLTSIPPGLTEEMGMEGRMAGLGGGVMYPPTSEAEAQKFFPGPDFNVTTKQEKADNGDVTTVIEAEFKDVNALLASPYGRAHQLTLKIEDGSLVMKAVSGMEGVARFAEMKDDTGMGMAALPGLADLQKKKDEMRSEFHVTLPNAITTTTGTHEGKTAAWIVERAKCKDAADFAQQLGALSEARCSAEGLKMSPVTPTRLGLLPFAELATGAGLDKGAAVDTNKIAAAVKFVPYGLSVTRSLDLSGGGGSQENAALLIGAVIVPQEFAPQKWTEAKLEEAVDAKGSDLRPGDSAEGRGSFMRSRYSGMENEEEESATNRVSEQRHVVIFSFRPPDWKINEIARIKGSVGLQYFGGSQVVKLTNAVPAGWIKDASKMMGGGEFDSSEKPLNSAHLAELGLSLSVQMGMVQGGMTMLTLQVEGKKAALTDAQVFDAGGKPWPTFLQQQDIGEQSVCQVVIAGNPQPPLSLALLASGGGTVIEVPVLLEHVALSNK